MPGRKKGSNNGVGYRRPPKSTQFKKGKSGNPRGRPKGRKNIGKVLLDVTGQRIAVTENGKTRSMPMVEVMLRRLANDAVNDQGALKLLFSLYERYGDLAESADAPNRDETLAEDREIYARHVRSTETVVESNPKKSKQNEH
jgi:Family of unknown function (DUF5681)